MKTTSVFRNPDPFLISYGFSADVKELNRSKRTAARSAVRRMHFD